MTSAFSSPAAHAELIKDALGGRRAQDGYMVRCPAHEDRNPSLHLTVGDRLLVKCHAGCDQERVLEELRRLTLWPVPEPRPTNATRKEAPMETVEAAWVYRDEEGTPVHRTVRLKGKRFFQEHAENGHWVKGMKDTKPVLYRLPELLGSSKDEPVWLTEGEKDADTLAKLGFVATSNAMGAKAWRTHYKEWLRGRDIIITEDNDEAGRARTAGLYEDLRGVARTIRVCRFGDCGEHGDVSDFIAAGGTREQLLERAVAIAAKPLDPKSGKSQLVTIPSMHDVQLEEISWLWYPYIPLGKFTLMEGDPGVRKSWLALAIASSVSLGVCLPGDTIPREPARVLLLAGEDGLGDTVKPRLMAMKADLLRIRPVTGLIKENEEEPMTLSREGIAALIDEVEAYRPGLVIIDPLVAYTSRDVDMNKANEVRSMLRPVTDMAQRLGVAIIALRHLNKVAGSAASYRGQGSIDYFAISRSVLFVGQDKSDPSRSIMAPNKSSLTRKGPGQAFKIGPGAGGAEFMWDGQVDTTVEDLLATPDDSGQLTAIDEAKIFLQEALFEGPVAGREVQRAAKDAGIAERTLWRAKNELKIHASKEHGPRGQWVWSLPYQTNEGKSANAAVSGPRADVWQSGRDAGVTREMPYMDLGLNDEEEPF